MQEDNDQARELLVVEHLSRVKSIATIFHNKIRDFVDLDDLISAGNLGLVKAALRFDPARNVSFRTFAEYKIRGAILDSIRGLDGIPGNKRKHRKTLDDASHRVEQKTKQAPSEEDMASELNLEVSAYREWNRSLCRITLLSLETGNREGNGFNDSLRDKRKSSNPVQVLIHSQFHKVLQESIGRMPSREKAVLALSYGKGLTYKEIGYRMNLNQSRICQLRAQAISKLQKCLKAKWAADTDLY